MVSSVILLALASVAAALKVTSPSSSDVWSVGQDETVTWDVVSSDQDTFNIYLSNMASYPSTTILLASDIDSSAGSATIDGSKLTAGNSFTINFTNGTETEQIYAQSNQFNITEGSTSSSSSASSSATKTATGTDAPSQTSATKPSTSGATATTATTLVSSTASGANHVNGTTGTSSTGTASATDSSATATGTGSSASGSSSSATATGSSASASSTSTSGAGKIVAGWVGFVGLAVLAL